VVSNFIMQALGEQTRSICYVDDLIEGLIRLLESPAEITGPINLGNPVEFSMRELAEQVRQLTGAASSLQFMPLPEDDPKQRQPDITRAKKLLGWKPHVRLEDGLRATIEFFKASAN
jgi:UDP-glucuronate decarboxylase